MIPKMPPREGQVGFLYIPPFRIQGISVAGEETVVQVPELDINFDMGQCTRASLSSDTVLLSHAHMDHLGALPYWLSQRHELTWKTWEAQRRPRTQRRRHDDQMILCPVCTGSQTR